MGSCQGKHLRTLRTAWRSAALLAALCFAAGGMQPAAAAQSGSPALVIFYHGVPDTTPEFTDASGLDAHLAARIGQVRATGGKAP